MCDLISRSALCALLAMLMLGTAKAETSPPIHTHDQAKLGSTTVTLDATQTPVGNWRSRYTGTLTFDKTDTSFANHVVIDPWSLFHEEVGLGENKSGDPFESRSTRGNIGTEIRGGFTNIYALPIYNGDENTPIVIVPFSVCGGPCSHPAVALYYTESGGWKVLDDKTDSGRTDDYPAIGELAYMKPNVVSTSNGPALALYYKSPFFERCPTCASTIYRLFQVKESRWHEVTKLNQAMLIADSAKAYAEVKRLRSSKNEFTMEDTKMQLQDALFRYLVDKVRLDQGGDGMDVVRGTYRAQDAADVIQKMQDEIKHRYLLEQ